MKVILAVSGGVDSVVMLHSLVVGDGFANTKYSNAEFIVAHFDHGIRGKDSEADKRFVGALAKRYNLKFESKRLELNSATSEATARKYRWAFLKSVMKKHKANFIATAHHADDVFETQIINLLRGTGRRGIDVLKETETIIRPLIEHTKAQIYQYVLDNKLEFVEDSTNQNITYLRNKLRLVTIPNFNFKQRERLATLLKQSNKLNKEIDVLLNSLQSELIAVFDEHVVMDRLKLIALPANIQLELLRLALGYFRHDKQKLSSKMITGLQKFAARKDSNKDLHLSALLTAHITKQNLEIKVGHRPRKKRTLV